MLSSQAVVQAEKEPASLPNICLVSLPPEAAAFGETSLASSWSAQDGAAVGAGNHCLAVAEEGCDVEASLALNVHEVAVG